MSGPVAEFWNPTGEQEAFLKAMDLLETELHRQLNRPSPAR